MIIYYNLLKEKGFYEKILQYKRSLWCITVYLFKMKKPVLIGMMPALVMTYVCSSYIFISPMLLGLENRTLAYILGGVLTVIIAAMAHFKARREE